MNKLNTMKNKAPLASYSKVWAGAVILALSIGAVSVSADTTLVSETFADGNRGTQNTPNSLAWFSSQTSPANVTTAVGDMVMSGGVTGGQHVVGYFAGAGTPVSVNVGESIVLEATFSPLTSIGSGDVLNSIRLGLFNSNGGSVFSADGDNPGLAAGQYLGYSGRFNMNGAAGNLQTQVIERTGAGGLITSSAAYSGALGTTGSINDSLTVGSDYLLNLTIARTAASELDVSFALSGGALASTITGSYTDSTPATTAFNTVALSYFGNNGNGLDSISISEVSVAMIPEPSTALIFLPLSALSIAMFRRRRKLGYSL